MRRTAGCDGCLRDGGSAYGSLRCKRDIYVYFESASWIGATRPRARTKESAKRVQGVGIKKSLSRDPELFFSVKRPELAWLWRVHVTFHSGRLGFGTSTDTICVGDPMRVHMAI